MKNQTSVACNHNVGRWIAVNGPPQPFFQDLVEARFPGFTRLPVELHQELQPIFCGIAVPTDYLIVETGWDPVRILGIVKTELLGAIWVKRCEGGFTIT